MPDPAGVPNPAHERETGPDLLAAISREMVRAMKTFYGKGPVKAKSYLIDDFLLVVMRGGQTPAEETMIEAGREDSVRSFRQEFENEMAERLIGTVEQLTGRKVVTYQSQILFKPAIVCELFFFDDLVPHEAVEQTAAAVLDPDKGVVTGDEV